MNDRLRSSSCIGLLLLAALQADARMQHMPSVRSDEGTSAGTKSFAVATVKPADPNGRGIVGWLAYPSGRIVIGNVSLKDLIQYAYDIDESQIFGIPSWAASARFNVEALIAPDYLKVVPEHQRFQRATPTTNEREMLRSLLIERFGLKVHAAKRNASVYFLRRSTKPLKMVPTKNPEVDPRGGVFTKGDVADGEAAGSNVSMPFLAKQLTSDLERPVIDATGVAGSYDFHIPPIDPGNHDIALGIFDAMNELGLKLSPGRSLVETIVIDAVERPTAN